MFVYPESDLDRPDTLLSSLGTFWYDTYQGNFLAESVAAGRAKLEYQAVSDLRELFAAVARRDVYVLHPEHWRPLNLLASLKNPVDFTLPVFDGTLAFDQASPYQWGVPLATPLFGWLLPPELTDVAAITNRITSPSRTLIKGIDFILSNGYLIFRNDPFADPPVFKQNVYQDNVIVDQSCQLWLCRSLWDRKAVYEQFGYVLDLRYPSGQHYKDLVNALFDSLVEGTTASHLASAWEAITGVPLAAGSETVEVVQPGLVVTDKTVYKFTTAAVILVSVGQQVIAGQPLCDALTFYEFNRGQCPTFDQVRAITLGRGMLLAGFFGEITFQNKTVPVIVTTDPNGFTKVSFEVDGWPGDTELFFDLMHERGLARGQTLAHLLDQRPPAARDTEPTAGALPSTINPMEFICANVLRDNAFLVVIKTASCLGGVGIDAAKSLRKVVPPQTIMLILTELEYADRPVKMDGPGTETAPGCEEAVSVFLGLNFSDTIGVGMITEDVRAYAIGGRCQ